MLLLNARLSQTSLNGYLRLRGLSRAAIHCVERIAAQSEEDARRFVRLGASTWDALRQRITNDHDAAFYQPESVFGPQDRARLAIVCSSRHELDEKLRRVLSRWETLQPAHRNAWSAEGIFYGYSEPRPDSPTTAFLFPGQGSQYPGMFAALLQSSPVAQAAAAQIAAALETLGLQPLAELIGPAAPGLGKVLWNTQASILCANWIADRTLRSYGIRPSVVAGHSFGEYAALASAGAWGITDGLRAARHRAEAIDLLNDVEGLMAAITAPGEVLGEVLAAVGDGVWVANQNSADQVVISGTTVAVRTAVDALQQRNVPAVILNVPRPFHSPLLAGAAEDLTRRLAQIPLVDTAVPVISTIGHGVMHRAPQFLQSLGAQLTTKVDFPAMLNEVARFRPALIVEIGPKQVLTRLAQTHFQATDVVCMATDNRLRPAELALLDVVAQAECLGCSEPTTVMAEPTRPTPGAQFIVYDATQRRRQKMKAKSQQAGQAKAAAPAPSPVNGKGHGETLHSNGAANGAHHAGANGLSPAAPSTPVGHTKSRVNAATIASAAVPAAAGYAAQARKPHAASAPLPQAPVMAVAPAPAPTATTSPGISGDEIQRVLVNFVVEQTGYPEEIIELDADLEGDLGIDSIKKAQLFGEVGMHYDIAPRDDLSLDDFSTLGHVLDFLAAELGASTTTAPAPQTPAPRTAEPVVQAVAPAVESAPASPTLSARAPVVATEATSDVDREALIGVLVNFVVEQTGYPEDIIELDADLEGDLGIDSIKKAQLFGEVGVHYDIAPRDDLSLDDFSTLGHVLDFLIAELGGMSATAVSAAPPAPAVTDTSTPTAPLPVRPEVAETPALEQPPVSAVPRTDQSGVHPGLPGGDMFRVAVLQGLAGQRGAQYGQALQNDIRAALATLADTCAVPATVGVASWPCGLNEALSAASAAAGVNQEAVAAANAILEPLDGWPLGFLAQSKPTGFAVPTPLVAHVHQELEAHVYLAVAEACRLHVRVGINSARLAVSCEPISLPASEADIVALTGKLHQVLAQAHSTAAALQQLGELQLTGDWCVGVSDPCQQEPQYLVHSMANWPPLRIDCGSMTAREVWRGN